MAKDSREYGYEGEMVMSQLKGIIAHAEQLHDMLEPDTDLPEWVQSKVTLAYDYMQTAADYMATEMKEDVQIDELSKTTLKSYLDKKKNGTGKDYPTSASFRKAMEAQGIARAKLGKTFKRRPNIDVKIKATNEEAKAGKYAAEDVQIDELSKTTLKSYINKADARTMDRTIDNPKANKKAQNRTFGIEKAAKKVNEEANMIHSVHVKTYDSRGEKQLNSPAFKKHVDAHHGEFHYGSDKGVAFKFKKDYHADAFHRGIQSHFRDLGSEKDGLMHEEGEGGPVNVAANVADPKNKRLFSKIDKRKMPSFKSFMKK